LEGSILSDGERMMMMMMMKMMKKKKSTKKKKNKKEEEETGNIISIYSDPHLNRNHIIPQNMFQSIFMIYFCQDSWDSEQLQQ
jgi:hypothetical protein